MFRNSSGGRNSRKNIFGFSVWSWLNILVMIVFRLICISGSGNENGRM